MLAGGTKRTIEVISERFQEGSVTSCSLYSSINNYLTRMFVRLRGLVSITNQIADDSRSVEAIKIVKFGHGIVVCGTANSACTASSQIEFAAHYR